ncbi:MAG: DsbA family protein [Alphaproteobacteria bacterium]
MVKRSISNKTTIFTILIIAFISTSFFVVKRIMNSRNSGKNSSQQSTSAFSRKTSSFPNEKREEIKEIVLDLIRDNPDLFIRSLNEGVQAQQEILRIKLESDATNMRKDLYKMGIPLGNVIDGNIRLVGFVDPVCPYCHDCMRIMLELIEKRKDVSINIVTVGVLAPQSTDLAKVIVAASKISQKNPKGFSSFLNKFFIQPPEIELKQLLQIAHQSGLDEQSLKKMSLSQSVAEELATNNKTAQDLKVTVFPMFFVSKQDRPFVIVPPMGVEDLIRFIDAIGFEKEENTTKSS